MGRIKSDAGYITHKRYRIISQLGRGYGSMSLLSPQISSDIVYLLFPPQPQLYAIDDLTLEGHLLYSTSPPSLFISLYDQSFLSLLPTHLLYYRTTLPLKSRHSNTFYCLSPTPNSFFIPQF
jgi:hypothetical protein